MKTREQLDTDVQTSLTIKKIDDAVADIIKWVEDCGFGDVPISAEDMGSMPVGSVVNMDGDLWTKEIAAHLSAYPYWTSERSPGRFDRYVNVKRLADKADSIRLVRWGQHITI